MSPHRPKLPLGAWKQMAPTSTRRRLEEQKVRLAPTWWNRNWGFRNVRTKWKRRPGATRWDFSVIKDIRRLAGRHRFPKEGTTASKSAPLARRAAGLDRGGAGTVDRQQKFCHCAGGKPQIPAAPPSGRKLNLPGLIKSAASGKSLTHLRAPQYNYACKTYGAFGKDQCSHTGWSTTPFTTLS